MRRAGTEERESHHFRAFQDFHGKESIGIASEGGQEEYDPKVGCWQLKATKCFAASVLDGPMWEDVTEAKGYEEVMGMHVQHFH